MKPLLAGLVTVGVLAGVAGCASTPAPPTVQTGPEAEVTIDGLYRVDNSVVALAYVKPDLDLQPYTKLMLDPVSIAYQRDPGSRRSVQPGAGESNYALSPSQMEDLRSWFQEAVITALTKDDGYEFVGSPGPDVLRITADLVDLIVRVPTQRAGGRDRSYARSYGEVSLIMELRDSQSGEILVRAGDRRDPTGNTAQGLVEVRPAFVRADVKRMFDFWADLLRKRLDEVRELGMG